MVTLPDNLKTLSVGDIVHVLIKWGNPTYDIDDDAEVLEYSERTGNILVQFMTRKNPDGSPQTAQLGAWAISRIVAEAPDDPELQKLKDENKQLSDENGVLKGILYTIHTLVSKYQ